MATNIQRRGAVYYFRRRVPLDLLEQYGGKREIIRSLNTKNRADAERLARKVSSDLDDEFEAARMALSGQPPAPPRLSQDSIAAIDPLYFDTAGSIIIAAEIESDEAEQAAVRAQDEAEAARLERVIAIIEKRRAVQGVEPIPGSVRTVLAPSAPATPVAPPAAGPTLEEIIPLWQRDRQPASKTVDAVTRAVREAKDPRIVGLTRRDIIAIRDGWIEAGNSVTTVNKKIGFVRLLLGVAKSRGLIEVNPAEDTELPPPKRAVELRQPYSPEQADAVMAATEGMRESDSAMYWLPRLARWTGARLNELHQLRREDVQAREGVPGVYITDEGEHTPGVALRLKNQGSRRWVPLAEAVRSFAEWAERQPEGPLFPAQANKYGIVSDGFSKRYGRFLRATLKIADKRVTFHSWRHGFADMCRAAGVPPDVRMALMGHAEGGVSGTYGAGDGIPAKRLIEAMAALAAA